MNYFALLCGVVSIVFLGDFFSGYFIGNMLLSAYRRGKRPRMLQIASIIHKIYILVTSDIE